MRKILVLLLLPTLLVGACSKKESFPGKGDYFVFGTSAEYCNGNCTQVFLLENGRLYADNTQQGLDPLAFIPSALSEEKYRLAKQLSDNFPAYLDAHPDTIIKDPMISEQSWMYFERRTGNTIYKWRITRRAELQPEEIREFIQLCQSVQNQL